MVRSMVSQNAVRRWGAGTAGIVRLLVATDHPLTGVTISSIVGVSQPRVSQVLKDLVGRDAVTATPDGYRGDPGALLDLYRTRSRPHLLGGESYWYGIRPLMEQAQRVHELAAGQGVAIAFSADIAPDLVAPWRHPTVAIIYVGDQLDLANAGLVPAEGRADATVIMRRTGDRSLLSPAANWQSNIDGFAVTDPCQQWWDLLDLGGADRSEAADYLEQAIIDRKLQRTR